MFAMFPPKNENTNVLTNARKIQALLEEKIKTDNHLDHKVSLPIKDLNLSEEQFKSAFELLDTAVNNTMQTPKYTPILEVLFWHNTEEIFLQARYTPIQTHSARFTGIELPSPLTQIAFKAIDEKLHTNILEIFKNWEVAQEQNKLIHYFNDESDRLNFMSFFNVVLEAADIFKININSHFSKARNTTGRPWISVSENEFYQVKQLILGENTCEASLDHNKSMKI